MKGTTVDGKIYAVPNLRNFGNIIGLNIDEDIAAEFGIENGQKLTMEEVDEFLTKAHEKISGSLRTGSAGLRFYGKWLDLGWHGRRKESRCPGRLWSVYRGKESF